MSDPGAQRIEARLKLLEIEAQVQRTTLAAHLAQWEQRQPLAWAGTVVKLASQVLSTPSARWLLAGVALRLIRSRWRAQPASAAPRQ